MVAIKTCCFCLSLRQGTYMSAVYAIAVSIVGIAVSSIFIHNADKAVKKAMSEMKEEEPYDGAHEDVADIASAFVKVIFWIALIIYLVWLLTAIFVFPALKRNKRSLLMPFLIFTAVLTGIFAFSILSSFTRIHETFADMTSAIQFVMQIAIVCLNIYVIICVSTIYKNNLREAHEVNALPVTSTVIAAPQMANAPPPAYCYSYHPAPMGDDMAKRPPSYDYQQPPPVYGHDSMTQKI